MSAAPPTKKDPATCDHYWDYSVETTRPLAPGEVARICVGCGKFEVFRLKENTR